MTARPRKKPDGVPLYLDMAGLCFHLSSSESAIDEWIKLGLIPAGRLIRGKRLWKTSKVMAAIDGEDQPEAAPADDAERIRENVKRQLEAAAR